MSDSPDPGLIRAWRRFDAALARVKAANSTGASSFEMPDAVADYFDTAYPLWERWTSARGLRKMPAQDAAVVGDSGGEVTAALMAARGQGVHQLVDHTDHYGWGTHAFGAGPYGGGWAWQAYTPTNPTDSNFHDRAAWFAAHLEQHLIVTTLEQSAAWFKTLPELAIAVE